MKRQIFIIWIFFLSIPLMAGGDIDPNLSAIADMQYKECKVNQLYIEKDAKLMWQDQAYADGDDGAYKRNRSISKAGTWNYAMHYCSNLNYAGYVDWRLPTVDELEHVHNKTGQVFTYHRSDDFWTSTPSTDRRYYAVYPVDAYRYKRQKKESNYIRCVRCIQKEKPSRSRYKTDSFFGAK